MDFRILGPLEVHAEGRRLDIGGARQRALLALLLLQANEVVSSDSLVAELWGEKRLDGAPKALQVAVSRLRRTLEPGLSSGNASELLITKAPGYELRVRPEQLDLHRFEAEAAAGREALAAGEPAAAAARLTIALEMWRGPVLADLAYESFAQAEIGRLEQLRSSALEDRMAAELEMGRHSELVGELQALVRAHPLRERLRVQLMLALYRSGRQAEALTAYQDARAALTEELGIEPSRELRELQQSVLRQDPALEPLAPDARRARSPGERFVGREQELGELTAALEQALAGHGRIVTLAGEPGIGKSRLAEELAAEARARGAEIIVGRCWEAGGAPAYWPWVQALRSYVRTRDPEALEARLGTGAGDLAQILPELRELLPHLPPAAAPEAEGARIRLFEAASELLRSAARQRPLVIMLDDLHAADEPSLLLLRFVAREIADVPVLVLGAYRDVDPALGGGLASTLAELAREPHTVQVVLSGLSDTAVGRYIEVTTGIEPSTRLCRMIRDETLGNPLFVTELVRLLDAEGRLGEEETELTLPPGIRAVIRDRVGHLSEGCRSLLVPASVLGREFGIDPLARLSRLSRGALLDTLDEAIGERVLSDVPGSTGRLRFGHALIRDALYEELSAPRRAALHQDAGEALEEVYESDPEPHLAELAHHFSSAGERVKAAGYARRAADRAAAQLAFEEAARLYETTIELVEGDAAQCDLLLALGEAQARAGDASASRRSLRRAADLAEELGLSEQLVRAALGYGGRLVWEVTRGDVHHVPLLERALAAIPQEDSALRVRLLTRLAGGPLRDTIFPAARRQALAEEALDMARRVGDPATLAYAIAGYTAANHSPEFTPTQAILSTELIELATAVGDLERAAEGCEHRATAYLELGEMERAKADFAVIDDLAERIRQPSQDWFVAVYGALVTLLEGQLAEAEEMIATARRVGERAQGWNAAVSYGLQLYILRREQGRLGEVEELVRRSVEEYPTYSIWRCVRTQMAAELGLHDEAREAVAALAGDGYGALVFDEEWLVSVGMLAEAVSVLEDRAAAAPLYDLLLPFSDRVAISYPEISTGAVAGYLGLLAATLDRQEDAERHFQAALAVNSRIGARPSVAHTQREYAHLLTGRDRPGDSARAETLMTEAQATYRELGIARFKGEAA